MTPNDSENIEYFRFGQSLLQAYHKFRLRPLIRWALDAYLDSIVDGDIVGFDWYEVLLQRAFRLKVIFIAITTVLKSP